MRRLVPHHESQLVHVAGVADEREGEADHRPSVIVQRLEGIRVEAGARIHRDLEIAGHAAGALEADGLGHRLDARDHGRKGPLRIPRRQERPRIGAA